MTAVPWLTMLWLAPVVGAAMVTLLAHARPRLAKSVGLAASLLVLAAATKLAAGFGTDDTQYQFIEFHRWIPSLGAGYTVGIDGIALVLVVLTAVLVPLLIIAGWNDAGERATSAGGYVALLLAVESLVMLSFVALDVTNEAAWLELETLVKRKHGRLDVAVLAAGIGGPLDTCRLGES